MSIKFLKINKIIKESIIGLIVVILGFDVFADDNTIESNRVAIVVNKYLKEEIDKNLNIYLQDLKNEGYEPILKEWDLENDPAPQTLKAYLKGLYLDEGGLQGAVFIGDLPIPIMKADKSLRSPFKMNISDGYIAERYYMDLIGVKWIVNNPEYEAYWDGFLDTLEKHDPAMLIQAIEENDLYPTPEIWTSRIMTSTLTGLFKKSEGQLVNAYLEKNHAYRTRQMVVQKQVLLYSMPKLDPAFMTISFGQIARDMESKFVVKWPPAPEKIDEFFQSLNEGSYEIFFWARHGMKTYINLGTEKLTSDILANTSVSVSTAFMFPASCWIGYYMEPAYFSGSYVFNEQFNALGMARTLPLFVNEEVSAIYEFVDGVNLGLALKKAIEIQIPIYIKKQITLLPYIPVAASSNSRYILGDGTLRLQSIAIEDKE